MNMLYGSCSPYGLALFQEVSMKKSLLSLGLLFMLVGSSEAGRRGGSSCQGGQCSAPVQEVSYEKQPSRGIEEKPCQECQPTSCEPCQQERRHFGRRGRRCR